MGDDGEKNKNKNVGKSKIGNGHDTTGNKNFFPPFLGEKRIILKRLLPSAPLVIFFSRFFNLVFHSILLLF